MTHGVSSAELALRECYAQLVTDFPSRELVDRDRLGIALLDAEGKVVLATDGVGVANVEALVATCKRNYDKLDSGDSVITNDPYSGGVRVQDHFLITPIEDAGKLVGYSVITAMFADVGGKYLGSEFPQADDLFGEGSRTRPVLIRRNDEFEVDVVNLLKLNSRIPVLYEADARVLSEVASRVAADLGGELAGLAEVLNAEKAALAEQVAPLDGKSAKATREIETGVEDRQASISVAARVENGKLVFDFTGSTAQLEQCHVNSTLATTTSAVAEAIRDSLGRKNTSALTEAFTVEAPEKSVVNCVTPMAVGGSLRKTGPQIYDAVQECLAAIQG